MEAVTVWVACAAAVFAILLALTIAVAWRRSERRMQAQVARLQERLDQVAVQPTPAIGSPPEPVRAEFLITDAGEERPSEPAAASSRVVLSATVGEPLVKAASLAYGVRRALRPENRNRIRFEMRRELRRARKARRSAHRAAAARQRRGVESS